MKVIIERMDHLGNGIGYINKKIVFVPKTVTGDEVEIDIKKEHKNYIESRLIKVLSEGEMRVQAFCPYYDKCGGCHLQNLSYENTLNYKKMRVQNILNKADIKTKVEVIKNDSPINYRNKIELKVKDGKVGFYSAKSHELIQVEKCAITKEAINNFIPVLQKMGLQNADVLMRANYNDELLIAIKTNDKIELNEADYPKYKVAGIILNDKCIYGENHFMDKINGYFFEVAYDAFFQVNSFINSKLFDIICENSKGKKILDLYSGVGTLSLMASKTAEKVYAIEYIPSAVANALKNAKINNVNNVSFILGKVEDKIEFIKDDIDTIIVDPPRQGLDDFTLRKLLDIKPQNIIYISCETQKLAEDLKKLKTKYTIQKIMILDMFSYTYHVECVCLLTSS